MKHCSLLLFLPEAAVYHVVMEEVRVDSVTAEQKCTVVVLGRLGFFSKLKKFTVWLNAHCPAVPLP